MNILSRFTQIVSLEQVDSWFNMALKYLYPFFGVVLMVFGAIAFVSSAAYKLHERDLVNTLEYYQTPQSGQRAMSDKPFRKYMLRCMSEWHYTMLSCIAIILAVTVHLTLETARNDIQEHLTLQILGVLSMTQALAGLSLSLLYIDSMTIALMTYGHTLVWVEGVIVATKYTWFNAAAVITLPTVWTAGAILTFASYRLVSGAIWMMGSVDTTWTDTDDTHQWMAITAVVYMAFIVVQSVLAARAFADWKNYAGPIPQIRL